MFYDTVNTLLSENYTPGDTVILKHHSIESGIPVYYQQHKAGDRFTVVKRDETSKTNPKYFIKSDKDQKVYRVPGYHIQSADKPLVKVTRVPKRLKGNKLCTNCGKMFSLAIPGMKHRDHCNFCLRSVHIDKRPGDREVWCGEGKPGSKNFKHSILDPVGVVPRERQTDPAAVMKYVCRKCGKEKYNRVAVDDNKDIVSDLPIIEPPRRLKSYVPTERLLNP